MDKFESKAKLIEPSNIEVFDEIGIQGDKRFVDRTKQ